MQRELPALFAVLFRSSFCGRDGIGRYAREQRLVLDPFAVGIGGIEHIFGKLRRQCGEFFLYLLETRLLLVAQFGPGETEVAHVVVQVEQRLMPSLGLINQLSFRIDRERNWFMALGSLFMARAMDNLVAS